MCSRACRFHFPVLTRLRFITENLAFSNISILLSADHVQEAVHHRLEVFLVILHSLDVGLDLLQMNLSGVPEEIHQGQHVPERI